jgi:hypothetical protein
MLNAQPTHVVHKLPREAPLRSLACSIMQRRDNSFLIRPRGLKPFYEPSDGAGEFVATFILEDVGSCEPASLYCSLRFN